MLPPIPAIFLVVCASQAQEPSLDQLTDQQLASRIPRYRESPWIENPASKTWTVDPTLAELGKRIEAGDALDVECWRTILIDRGYLRWREQWPEDVPFAVSFHLPKIGKVGNEITVTLAPTEPEWKAAIASCGRFFMCGLAMDDELAREDYQELGRLRPDQESAKLAITVELPVERSEREASNPIAVRVGTIELKVRPVDGINDVLEGCDDAAFGRLLAESSDLGSGRDAPWLAAMVELPRGLACSLEVALVRDGCEGPISDLLLKRDRVIRTQGSGYCEIRGLALPIARGQESATGLSVRLRGTSADVQRDWDATRYWTGEVEIPVAELVERWKRHQPR